MTLVAFKGMVGRLRVDKQPLARPIPDKSVEEIMRHFTFGTGALPQKNYVLDAIDKHRRVRLTIVYNEECERLWGKAWTWSDEEQRQPVSPEKSVR